MCDRLEGAVQGDVVTHASITARPFFEKRGYRVVKEQQVERNGVFLTNFVMVKRRRGGGIFAVSTKILERGFIVW